MAKSPDAFRTISEVAKTLDTPAHVLRFWESKFSQIKPIKRAGSRRYYRPEDVQLLQGIKTLLHEQGMTIKGAQKLLREKGIKHVQGIGTDEPQASEPTPELVLETKSETPTPTTAPAPAEPKLEISNITAFRPRTAEAKPVLPANPAARDDMTPRFFGASARITDDAIKARAAQIAPLLVKLEAVRDQMRRS